MDKITKLLKKLTIQERGCLEKALAMLVAGNTSSLDTKKLKGVRDVYRVRIGDLRIIFQKQKDDIRILEVSRRDKNTYGNY